jgi:amphiphysin
MRDERMKELIPSILESISAFFAPILNIMYSIQSDLFQHLYASVYEYANAQGHSNTDDLVEECFALYEPIRQKAETEIKSLREGKTGRTPMGEGTGRSGLFGRKPSASVPAARPSTFKSTATAPASPIESRKSSSTNNHKPPPPPPPAGPSSTLTPSFGSRQNSYGAGSRTPSSSSLGSDAVKNKRPPPPPPPKPSISPKPDFVVAKYDFAGESPGDLAFKVGARIKIIKKTDSLEDWWEGELNGERGMFPRNYCE